MRIGPQTFGPCTILRINLPQLYVSIQCSLCHVLLQYTAYGKNLPM